MAPRLNVSGVVKRFGGTLALDGFGFSLEPGEVRGLIGENGSGKSTAMKVISGEIAPDEGSVTVDGVALPNLDPTARLTAGVGVVMQDPHLCLELTVAENLYLGRLQRRFRAINWKQVTADAQRVLDEAGIPIDARKKVVDLSQDERHMVEVARVLAFGCKVVGFDETTASLTEDHVAKLFSVMRTLKAQGASQVFISHRLPEVLEICDTVTVLRDGQLVGTIPTDGADEADLIEMMVGRSMDGWYVRTPLPPGEVVLETKGMVPDQFPAPVDLQVRAGEVVGIGGLVGSGRSSILEAIYGLERRSGDVVVAGVPVKAASPREAIRAGMGLVPEDRRIRGLAMEQTVRENATAVRTGSQPLRALNSKDVDAEILEVLFDKIRLKAASSEIAVSTLSGGNQQKIVIGRWLHHTPKLLLLDEPTRGIDIAAKKEIHQLIDELAKDGMALLVVSSELPELIGLCDRVIMMREGRVAGEFIGAFTEQDLMTAAAGSGDAA
ncbi:MAG: sugar ABC transporter ATP-binding protein [Actinobacteria bacterium]|nr:sugar ABC transporter ATP-binding protein [Actinomycetota bacterium]